jgi:hypothetical protein
MFWNSIASFWLSNSLSNGSVSHRLLQPCCLPSLQLQEVKLVEHSRQQLLAGKNLTSEVVSEVSEAFLTTSQ